MPAFCPNSPVLGVEDGVVVDGKDWPPLRLKTDIAISSCGRGGGEVVEKFVARREICVVSCFT